RSSHEHVVVLVELLDRHDRGDLLAFLQREHVDDRLAAAGAAAGGHFVHLEPVQPAAVREAQQVIVRMRDEQALDEVVLLHRGGHLAAAAAAAARGSPAPARRTGDSRRPACRMIRAGPPGGTAGVPPYGAFPPPEVSARSGSSTPAWRRPGWPPS